MVASAVLPVVLPYSKDRVPNVKFNVAKMLQAVAPMLDRSTVDGQVKPCLVELTNDSDPDVKYFARRALVDGGMA